MASVRPQGPHPTPSKTELELRGYRAVSGAADELVDGNGAIRPVWRPFLRRFHRLAPDELKRRFARGDQSLRDAGVFYRQYEGDVSSERDWPLSHIPVLLSEEEWRHISDGLIQRAELLEAVLADLYGPATLITQGHLPAGLIASSQEWLRPLVGVPPRSGHYLHFVAFDLGRGPSGSWWVLGDRTQAPSGAGFALENRIATSRVFPEHFVQANVVRLAGFFRSFRDALEDLRTDPEGPVGILTPGRLNDAYFEHAFIARYLGFMLLQGEDITVVDGRLMVRTVAGLRPISVLWRRVDSSFTDPLELDERSQLGTPGLVSALRNQHMTLVNALGSGVLEIRAMAAFLPRLSRAVLGEELRLPNIATWWCGQAAERAHVMANAANMMVGPALSTAVAFDPSDVASRERADAGPIERRLKEDGGSLVGQEVVRLSTTPACIDGTLVPRPMVLRLFLARVDGEWQVMPGGYARIGRTSDASAISLQGGGSVADVWVVGEQPVTPDSMLGGKPTATLKIQNPDLPSRAADNLFWLGRYIERAEHLMRLMRAYHLRLGETADRHSPLISAIAEHLESNDIEIAKPLPDALIAMLRAALTCASHVRERFSVDGWVALTELATSADTFKVRLVAGDETARAMSALLRRNNAFSGLVHDNMYRFSGWRFLSLGRAFERAITTAALLARFADPKAPEGAFDTAIEVGDSVMTHRRRYEVGMNRATVVDLLALDELNPRSIRFQLAEAGQHARLLPQAEVEGRLSPLCRAILRAHTDLAVSDAAALDTAALIDLELAIGQMSDLLTSQYLS